MTKKKTTRAVWLPDELRRNGHAIDGFVRDRHVQLLPKTDDRRVLHHALKQVLAGSTIVVVIGRTSHHCQTQLIPMFGAMASKAGLKVTTFRMGKLRVGHTSVHFQPLDALS